MRPNIILLLTFMIFNITTANANDRKDLESIATELDSQLFNAGFNKCNLEIIDRLVHKELDFYHDISGKQSKAEFLEAIKTNVCQNPNRKIRRALIAGTMNVYPLKNNGKLYGIIQEAQHAFFMKEHKKEEYQTGIAKFTHTWVLENNVWKLIESLSFEHEATHNTADIPNKFNANYAKKLFDTDAAINDILKQHKIPSLAIGVIENGQLQQIRTFGKKSINPSRDSHAVSFNTIYKVASLTKPITAMVAIKLVNQGKWDIDEPIQNYYLDPDLKKSPELKYLTTRHILSHQSGLPNWRYLEEDGELKFHFKPGAKFQYSGEGFEYLRKALEQQTNQTLEQLAEQLIFEPLEMNNTYFRWNNKISENNYAYEHDENGMQLSLDKHTNANAAANLLTTIEDYCRFMLHILNGANLDTELYKDMLSNQLNTSEVSHFGLGWKILKGLPNEEFALQHTGGDYGLKSIALLLPKSKRGLVIFINSENGMVLWSKILEEYWKATGLKIVEINLNS